MGGLAASQRWSVDVSGGVGEASKSIPLIKKWPLIFSIAMQLPVSQFECQPFQSGSAVDIDSWNNRVGQTFMTGITHISGASASCDIIPRCAKSACFVSMPSVSDCDSIESDTQPV